MKHEDHLSVEYLVRGARFEGHKLVALDVHCTDVGAPSSFLYEVDPLTVHDVVNLIKHGEKVEGVWPAGQVWRPWPLEVVQLADGSESVEAVDKNRPEGFVVKNLATSVAS